MSVMLLIVTASSIGIGSSFAYQTQVVIGQGQQPSAAQPLQKNSQILAQQPLQKQQQQISNTSQVLKQLQPSPPVQQRNAPKPIEGVDNVVFKITSPDLLSMLNNIKNRLPHAERYSDYQLNTPLSVVFPIYASSSSSNFYIYPSELVDIKQKVLDSMATLSPSQFRNPNPNTIQVISVKHDVYNKQTGGIDTCRNVIDFEIKSSDLAAKISTAKVPTPDLKSFQSLYNRNIPINSELEIRARPVTMSINPNQVKQPPLNVEQTLIQTLFGILPGAPVSSIPAVAPQDIAITSIDYIC
jgi:hypothetical protein